MARLFTGIFPPDDRLAAVRDLRTAPEGVDARWMPPENLHATLVFIGHVSDGNTGMIAEALEHVRFDAFDVRFSGVGAFPNPRKARVLWVAIEPAEPVVRLREMVDSALTDVLLERNSASRPYHPHITVARTRGKRRVDARSWVDLHAGFLGRPFSVQTFALVRSRTKTEGAEYTIIKRYGAEARNSPP